MIKSKNRLKYRITSHEKNRQKHTKKEIAFKLTIN